MGHPTQPTKKTQPVQGRISNGGCLDCSPGRGPAKLIASIHKLNPRNQKNRSTLHTHPADTRCSSPLCPSPQSAHLLPTRAVRLPPVACVRPSAPPRCPARQPPACLSPSAPPLPRSPLSPSSSLIVFGLPVQACLIGVVMWSRGRGGQRPIWPCLLLSVSGSADQVKL